MRLLNASVDQHHLLSHGKGRAGANKSGVLYRMGGVAITTGCVRTGLRYGLAEVIVPMVKEDGWGEL